MVTHSQVYLTILEHSTALQITTSVHSTSTTTSVCLVTAQLITALICLITVVTLIALQITTLTYQSVELIERYLNIRILRSINNEHDNAEIKNSKKENIYLQVKM
ncbi:9847_t:CDS:2 [Funneliformis mosseae]|uniref:9847_t:CDS:1 n=1 Tax=Funneliformis mosseae TaxID=27381 RepID=A0A9N9GFT9_FUNMO|nr:9847_t:CDS:2 [Funneliformis mosseae]